MDGTAPVVTIDPGIEGTCYNDVAAAEAAVRAATTVSDDCTSLEELNVALESTVTPCSLRVRISATDLAGHRSEAAVTVRVDPEPPRVEAQRLLLGFRGEVLGFQTPVCYDTAAEAEAAVLAVTRFTDNCTPSEWIATSVSSSGGLCSLAVTPRGVDECANQSRRAPPRGVDCDIVGTCADR